MATRYDLTQLSLGEGGHQITVVATATGYRPSEHSNAVTYLVPYHREVVIPTTFDITAATMTPTTITIPTAFTITTSQMPTRLVNIPTIVSVASSADPLSVVTIPAGFTILSE